MRDESDEGDERDVVSYIRSYTPLYIPLPFPWCTVSSVTDPKKDLVPYR